MGPPPIRSSPRPPRRGPASGGSSGGGGTVWDAIVYDDDFKQLIIGVGNGSPWNQRLRSPGGGDNWFLSSIVALDAATGAYKWHYQTTPGDTWDYTATQPIILAELPIGGKPRKVAMQAPKNGFFYVVDRENGLLITAQPFLPMSPAKSTPPGMPVSWAYAVDPATGRPVENPEARYRGGAALVRPGPLGAHNWQPMSFSPETGLVYLPAQDLSFPYTHDASPVTREGFWNLGVVLDPLPDDNAVRAAIKSATKGVLLAWDPVAQREVWRSERRGAWNGGTLATAGGLVFQGTGDGQFLALDARTGKTLWSTDNQAATLAGPISYEIGGEQYIAVVGGHGGSFFLVYGFAPPRRAIRSTVESTSSSWAARRRGRRSICRGPRRQAARHRDRARRLLPRRSPLRKQLHGVPRRGGCYRRRPSRPSAIAPAAGRRRLATRRGWTEN